MCIKYNFQMKIRIVVALNFHHASYQQTQCILLKGESPVQFATDICATIGSVNKLCDRVVARGSCLSLRAKGEMDG